MRKGSSKPKTDIAEPTPEQMHGGVFELQDVIERSPRGMIAIGKAWCRVPMIKVLFAARVLSYDEFRALKHYRHHADMADHSPIRDSLNIQRGGGGNGLAFSRLHAQRVRDDCERSAGQLADILRAVVIYDLSLNQWAIRRGGSIERRRVRKGRPVVDIEARPDALEVARLEIRMAAQRVMAELDSEPLDRQKAA